MRDGWRGGSERDSPARNDEARRTAVRAGKRIETATDWIDSRTRVRRWIATDMYRHVKRHSISVLSLELHAMRDSVEDIRTLDELRDFIHQKLCEKENLLPDQFRMSEMQLIKRGRSCGMQFLLQGPRSVRLGAIWASDHNEIYLYDTQGVRYQKVRLKCRLRIDEQPSDAVDRPAA